MRLGLNGYVEHFCAENQRGKLAIADEVFDALRAYSWPGNVRELKNVAEQLVIFAADPITVARLLEIQRSYLHQKIADWG